MSGAHGAGLVLDSQCGAAGEQVLYFVCPYCLGLAQSSKALAGAWGRLAMVPGVSV